MGGRYNSCSSRYDDNEDNDDGDAGGDGMATVSPTTELIAESPMLDYNYYYYYYY